MELLPLDNFMCKIASSLMFLDEGDKDLFLSAVRSTLETAKYTDYLDKSAEDILMEAAVVTDMFKYRNKQE
jgi:hypothetical protein